MLSHVCLQNNILVKTRRKPVPSCLRSQKGGPMMLHQEVSGLPYHSMIYCNYHDDEVDAASWRRRELDR